MTQNTVKQTENFGEIIGLLKKKNIKFGVSKNGKNYANGSIEIEVENQFGTNVIKVDVMQMELKNDGEVNKNYKALQTISSEYKSIEENGKENADLIQVFVKLEENNYVIDGEVKEGMKLLASTNFDKKVFAPIKRVSDVEHKATISFGGMITKIIPNDTTGELKVEMIGATFTGKAIKHRMDVSKELAQGFRGVYQEGAVTTLHYMPINAVEVQEVKQQVAFGNAPSYSITNTTRKNLVCGGDPVNYTSDMTQEVVKQMLVIRENELETLKENANNQATATTTTTAFGNVTTLEQKADNNPFGGGNPFGSGVAPAGNPFGA